MSIGTITVKTPEGEEKEVELAEILAERRKRNGESVVGFQTKILWSAGASAVGLLVSTVIYLASSRLNGLENKVEQIDNRLKQMEISTAQTSASTEVKYTQIIRDLTEIKADMRTHLDQARAERPR